MVQAKEWGRLEALWDRLGTRATPGLFDYVVDLHKRLRAVEDAERVLAARVAALERRTD